MDGNHNREERPWFVDANTGEVAAFSMLLASIDEMRSIRLICQPVTAREALEELVKAASAGVHLTFLDHSLTRSEAERLGLDAALINREWPCEARYSAASFPHWLAGTANPGFVLELFTSGSTGLPAKVAHTLDILGRAVRVSDRHAHDVWALAYPATHVAGVQVALQAMRNGNTLVDVTKLRGVEAVEAIIRHGVTHISATPTYYRLIAAVKRPMPLVRAVSLGGEPADGALLAALHDVFPHARLRNIYASTEAGTVLESEGDLFSVPDSLSHRVRITDGRLWLHRSLLGSFSERTEDGGRTTENAGQMTEGRLPKAVGANQPAPNNPQPITSAASAAVWYDTGDTAEVVSADPLRFRITGRCKEWVNVGGDKVNPREVEAVLRQHPAVLDAAVSGRANSVLGSLLEAEVVLRSAGATEAELRAFVGERLQPFKVPRIIRVVTELKSTFTGKALRR